MTSLTDVYDGKAGRVATRRQQLLGTGLFLAGAVGLVTAIALATTGLGTVLGLDGYVPREVAGVVAGIGLPAVVLGIFTVLPAGPRTRIMAGVGAAVALLGVTLFQHIYPYSWVANAPLLALGVSTVYFSGVLTTFWCLFAALATFKTRNDPGGSARMRVTEEGTIELVEKGRSIPGLGGIGLFGTDPDGSVETQTNRTDEGHGTVGDGGDGSEVVGTSASAESGPSDPQPRFRERTDSQSTPRGPSERDLAPELANAGPEASPSTDGGTTAATGQDPITETALHQGEPDSYCGNCRHFQYVMDGDDIEPYCTYHEELLDDMEACPAWVDNG
jgi:hypothetical protein